MENEKRHSFLKSFGPAWMGMKYAFREERNFQIQMGMAFLTIFLMFLFPLTFLERAVLFLIIGFILALELVNTTFERLLDMVEPNINPQVKIIKDLAAGAVLVSATVAVVAGLAIFLPYWF